MANIALQLQKLANNAQIQVQKLSNEATKKTLDYNKAEANTAREWQKMMSDSSHQREVTDLKKAGLNPVLSVNQGAQSYTTSAASGQAENPAGAYASLTESMMNARMQQYSADKSAAAQRYAAQQSAAAMKAAAAAQAAAARYAADTNFASNKYGWDKKAEIQKGINETNKWIAQNQQSKNIVGLADKYIGSNLPNSKIKDAANLSKKFNVSDFANNGKITKSNFILTRNGSKRANQGLLSLGLPQTKYNRTLYVQAFVFGSQNAMSKLGRIIASYKRAANNVSRRPSLYW